jgi:hypothetical protein
MVTIFWSRKKPYGKTAVRVLKWIWEGNMKMFLSRLQSGGTDLIQLGHARPLWIS